MNSKLESEMLSYQSLWKGGFLTKPSPKKSKKH